VDFYFDIEISVIDEPGGSIVISLPHNLICRLYNLARAGDLYNICAECSWEVRPDELCNCGRLGGYLALGGARG
jgi:hypothetical protein